MDFDKRLSMISNLNSVSSPANFSSPTFELSNLKTIIRSLPSILLPNQRKFRHVKGILCRNLRTTDSGFLELPTANNLRFINHFFTLHKFEIDGEDKEFYKSEIVSYSLNPVWRNFHKNELKEEINNFSNFRIKIWNIYPVDGGFHISLLIEQPVELKQVLFLGTDIKHISFGINTIIIELSDGFYAVGNAPVVIEPTTPPIQRRSPTEGNREIYSFFLKHKLLMMKNQEIETVTKTINDHLSKKRKLALKKEKIKILNIRISQLKQELSYQNEQLQKEKDLVKLKVNDIVPSVRTISQAEISLMASKKLFSEDKVKLARQKQILKKIQYRIEWQRRKLISQLASIYSIDIKDDSPPTINGVPLPNSDFTGADEEDTSIALGFICHLLFMISKYLDLPLKFPLLLLGSHSSIYDDVTSYDAPKFPLYPRGVDNTRFEYAVFLLNKNIEQLINHMGVEVKNLRNTLPNIITFFACYERRSQQKLQLSQNNH